LGRHERTRNGKDWTDSFPSLAASLENLKAKDAVLDVEAVIVDAQGKSSFQALQAALGDGGNPNKIIAYVFDLLHLDGKDLTPRPLTERKEKLEALLNKSKQHSAFHYSEHIVGQGAKMFAKACERVFSDSAPRARANGLWEPSIWATGKTVRCGTPARSAQVSP
jgi:bifunctional non-homologous end joining protein LigD